MKFNSQEPWLILIFYRRYTFIKKTQTNFHVWSLRTMLQKQEYDKWCNLRIHGKGAILYQEYTPANRWTENLNGLSSTEWQEALKMQYNVVPVRTLPGHSRDRVLCRHCREPETLGSCSRGDLLRNSRHNRIRSKIASAFSKKGCEVYMYRPSRWK